MTSWLFQPEHDLFRKTVRTFLDREIAPDIEEWEALGQVPRHIFRTVGAQGYLGVGFPEADGGLGGDVMAEAVWIEELARLGSGGVGAALSGHTTIGLMPIGRWANAAQKARYLRPGIRGDCICALAVTEPDAGSDVASIRTVATEAEGGFRLNGTKLFITNGTQADVVVVAAKTRPDLGHRGISLFLVERSQPGFRVGRRLDKLGWRASDTAELFFDDVLVPADHLLGEPEKGFYYLMEGFQWERITLALSAVALAERALWDALAYSQARQQFGRALRGFQVIRHHLVDLAVDVEKARQLTYRALYLYATEGNAHHEAAMAKAYAGEMARRVTDGALQVFGGNGYMMDYPTQRYWRDARVLSIGGGATEVMYEVIANALLNGRDG